MWGKKEKEIGWLELMHKEKSWPLCTCVVKYVIHQFKGDCIDTC